MSGGPEGARLRAVLDTNILVRMVITPDGLTGRLRAPLGRGAFTLVTTEWILAELREVLGRRKMRRYITLEDVAIYFEVLRLVAEILPGDFDVDLVPRDLEDNPFVACALEGRVSYLVSGDEDHLQSLGNVRVAGYEVVHVVSAPAFLRILRRESLL